MQSKLNAFVRKDFSTVNQAVKNVESLAYNRLGLIVPSNLEKTKDLNGLAKFFETQLKARDIFRVPYYHRTGSKAGKVFSHVRTENYCKMLARTLTAEADRKAVTDIIEETFKPYGDLVQFVRRGDGYSEHSCDDCDFLLDAYLSLNGETKGYTTVPEAEAEYDIFHPNCIHTLRITDGVLQQYEYLGVEVPRDTQVKYEDKLTTIDNVYLYNNKSDILAKLYPSELNAIDAKQDKRILLKYSIKDRNRNKHNDLTNADFKNALTALYKPNIILQDSGNNNYYHFIRSMNNTNYVVLLDKAPQKDYFEIVHIHKMRKSSLTRLLKKHKKIS